jgi:hypothetical protein
MQIPTTNHLLLLDLELTAGKSKSNRCRRCNLQQQPDMGDEINSSTVAAVGALSKGQW